MIPSSRAERALVKLYASPWAIAMQKKPDSSARTGASGKQVAAKRQIQIKPCGNGGRQQEVGCKIRLRRAVIEQAARHRVGPTNAPA